MDQNLNVVDEPKKGNSNLLLWAVGAIILLALLIWIFGPYGKNTKETLKKSTGTEVVSTGDDGNANSSGSLDPKDREIENLKCEVRDLKKDLADREGKLAQANSTIAMLAECCGGKKSTTYYKPTAPAAPKNTGGSGNTIKRFVPAPTGTGTETVIAGATLPRATASMKKGEVEVCWQFGLRVYYPYIAIQENNEQFPNLIDNNGQKGFNLAFLPSGTVGSTGASCGVTYDYTHWLRVSEAQKYQTWITFDIPRAMVEGVFVPATLIEVNGEQFFVVTALDYQKWISQTRGQ